mmetsp:Transcript_95182/g.268981  ORF Transcript_95182/g.268981 Transcript_95182/m.268981 type:complete len:398 (+) Transcript_95182:68-1261(+)
MSSTPAFGSPVGSPRDPEIPSAPKPPCNTPRRYTGTEPEVRDELADARTADGGGGASGSKWHASAPLPPMPMEKYRILASIGSGCFSSVYLAETADGRRVAVKCAHPDAGREMREVQLLRRIRHPCVVPLVGAYMAVGPGGGESLVHIVMEFLPQTLHIRIGGRPLKCGDIRCLGLQLLRALAHLDGMRICHRDLKPENILLDGDALKLADFGSAKMLHDGPSTSYICSRWWRAPELILGSTTYSTSADWWSCGCIFTEMMLGRPLFRGSTSWGQIEEIVRALGAPTRDDLHALGTDGENQAAAARLQHLRCQPRGWEELLPNFAGEPEVLELAPRLLVYNPCERWHPTEMLLSNLFTSRPLPAPLVEMELTEDELRFCRPAARQELARLFRAPAML